MSPYPNFDIQKFYQNEPKHNCVYSKNNLSKIKDGTYIIIIDESESIRTHWTVLYENSENITDFEVEHILKQIRKFIGKKNTVANVFRTQAYHSIMCEYLCIGFIDFMLKRKSLFIFS